ncbi:hypothetical protein JB92DRAFT_3027016, partial [Gautieria morchelliformis]
MWNKLTHLVKRSVENEHDEAKAANGTAFYTPENGDSGVSLEAKGPLLIPKQMISTPSGIFSEGLVVHSQEELVASLREQLSLQHQLASQYEVDLTARDELVSLLSTQLQNAEAGAEKYRKEVQRRQTAMRGLRHKLNELEMICRGLEDEIERSREESFERSVMDEASEGALVVLHGNIGQLKGELEKAAEKEAKLRRERDLLTSEVDKFGDERQRLEGRERELNALVESKTNEIQKLEDKVEEANLLQSQAQQTIDSLQAEVAEKQQVIDDEREKSKAEDDVALGSVKERVATLTDEIGRLKRQVHDLQQESADKEVKLLQLNKARAQDKEDKEGLNIALDSKQQELELLKRKLGVKGTGGSTPAPVRVGLPDLASRRQSVAFTTPSAPRPRPGAVTAITKPNTAETPLKKALSARTGTKVSTSAFKPSRVGTGPPPASRGTPLSASTSSLVRSTSSSKPRSSLPLSHRRSSSVMSSNASFVAESDKENEAPVKTAVKKPSMV